MRYRLALFVLILTAALTGVALVVGYLTPPILMMYRESEILRLRDLHTELSAPLPEGATYGIFSPDGRLAYTKGDRAIYIWDYQTPLTPPVNLTDGISFSQLSLPIAWSQDGSHLAVSTEMNGIQVWDGQRLNPIAPLNMEGSSWRWVVWGPENQLAIDYGTYTPASDSAPELRDMDLYLWDGDRLINVSQNPQMAEYFVTWSQDGQLAFLSRNAFESKLVIWDGKLTAANTVDPNSLIHLTSQLGIFLDYLSVPHWTESNSLSFFAHDQADDRVKLYRWDGRILTIIGQADGQDIAQQAWYNGTRWARQIRQPDTQLRDLVVQEGGVDQVIVDKGSLGPMIWSPDGDLYFCIHEDSYHVLKRWDGSRLHEEARNYRIMLYLPNVAPLDCMSPG